MLLEIDLEMLGDLIVQTTKDAVAPFQAQVLALQAELAAVKAATPAAAVDLSAVLSRLDALDGAHESMRKSVDMRFELQAAKTYGWSLPDEQIVLSRLTALETKAIVPGPKGDPGKDADPVDLVALAREAAALIPKPKDGLDGAKGEHGRSVEIADIAPLLAAEATKAVAQFDMSEMVKSLVTDAVSQIERPKDGIDGTSIQIADVAPLIVAEVEKAVALLPKPADGQAGAPGAMGEKGEAGRSLEPADVVPLILAEVEKAVHAIPKPKDGVGLAGAVIDRDGHLVVTLTDGATKALGPVVGEVDMDAVAHLIAARVAEIPRPKDGKDGTLENLKARVDDERTLTLCFKDGLPVEGGTIHFPVPIYRGVYQSGKAYEQGDSVTFGGSQWIAREDTTAKPAEGKSWQLSVRCGRDGREGKQGPEGGRGPQGPKGEPGIYR